MNRRIYSTDLTDQECALLSGGKKISGRKRHLLVDTVGLRLTAKVPAANILENKDGKLLLANLSKQFRRITHCCADMGYGGDFPERCKQNISAGGLKLLNVRDGGDVTGQALRGL